MRVTMKHHTIAHARLRELQSGAVPYYHRFGICGDINNTFANRQGKETCGYEYCDKIFKRMTGEERGWPIGYQPDSMWRGNIGKDRRAFAGFMADFIEHTYL